MITLVWKTNTWYLFLYHILIASMSFFFYNNLCTVHVQNKSLSTNQRICNYVNICSDWDENLIGRLGFLFLELCTFDTIKCRYCIVLNVLYWYIYVLTTLTQAIKMLKNRHYQDNPEEFLKVLAWSICSVCFPLQPIIFVFHKSVWNSFTTYY